MSKTVARMTLGMGLHIVRESAQHFRIFVGVADNQIAMLAENPSYLFRLIVFVVECRLHVWVVQ
jgi:hypothetical protein